MTDQVTSGTSTTDATGTPPGQPVVTQPPPSQTENWEARYKGMVKANSEKDQQIQSLTAQLATKEQQIATLLGEKDTLNTTWETKVSGLQNEFTELKSSKDTSDQEHATVLAELAKLRALSQHPDLMVYADLIQPTTDAAELEAQIVRVQQIHAGTLDAARKGLQQQGFVPPTAPPVTQPGAVTEATLEKQLDQAKAQLARGEINQTKFLEMTAEIGQQYNLLQRGAGGQ